jgi:membrane protease YdiL (CAAX protease family)
MNAATVRYNGCSVLQTDKAGMDNTLSLFLTGGVLLYIGIIIYTANNAERIGVMPPVLNTMLYSLTAMLVLFGVNIALASAIPPDPMIDTPQIDPAAGIGFMALTMLAAFGCVRLITAAGARAAVRRFVGGGAYNPDSSVHLTALIVLILLILYTLGSFILSGGIEGLAASYSAGIAPAEFLFQQTLWVVFAFLGVGALIRRDGRSALARLGLGVPNVSALIVGAVVGIGLYAAIIGLGAVWVLFVTPEQLAEQTAASQQLAQSFDTLPLIFLLSVSVALGEEILFRGALQPIFGIGLTSVFFALLHTQYTLTPASFGIFFVSLGIGWLRLRYDTWAAISAHFVYNFIQLFLAFLAASWLGGG